MAWRYFFCLFATVLFSIAVAPQALPTPPLKTISIKSEQFVIDPADIVLGSTTVSARGPAVSIGNAVVSEDKDEDVFVDGVEVLTGHTNAAGTTLNSFGPSTSQSFFFLSSTTSGGVAAASSSSTVLHTTTWNLSMSDPLTPASGAAISRFPSAQFDTKTSNSSMNTASSRSNQNFVGMTDGIPAFSMPGIKNSSSGAQVTTGLTNKTFTQSWVTTSTFSFNQSQMFIPSFSSSATAGVTTKAVTDGSTTYTSSTGLTRPTNLRSNITSYHGTAIGIDTNAFSPSTSVLSTSSISSQAAMSRTVHNASTSTSTEGSRSMDQTFLLSTSSSISSSLSLPAYLRTGSLTTFSTATSHGTNTLTAIAQIVIPATPLSPDSAAAIAGGIAIGEGLAFLYAKALGISDESALLASKTEFHNSIDALKIDLERLHLDLGGGGVSTPCGSSKSRFRQRKSIVSNLLDTITKTICSLTEAQAHIDTVPPDLSEIEADWVAIAPLAAALTAEETEEEEEEEEKEKESQSAEEQKTSLTDKSNIASSTWTHTSTSVSSITSHIASSVSSTSTSSAASSSVTSVSASFWDDVYQGYPVNYFHPQAADDAVLAVAGDALFAIMGDGNDSTIETSSNRSSATNTISTVRFQTSNQNATSVSQTTANSNTNYPSDTTYGYPLNSQLLSVLSAEGISINSSMGSTSRPGSTMITTSISSVATNFFATETLSKSEPDATLPAAPPTFYPGESSTSEIALRATSASEASISSVSAASVSVASSFSAISASAASAAAAAFPSQIRSDHGGSILCHSVGADTCKTAYSYYNPQFNYTHYTSYVQTAGGFGGEWLGWGCAAMFVCESDQAYAKGMTGQQILNAFAYLYAEDEVGVCGSVYLENGCHLTVNACDFCKSSIPCDALPEQAQPPKGGVPCYYNDGTTWPPVQGPPVRGGGNGLQLD